MFKAIAASSVIAASSFAIAAEPPANQPAKPTMEPAKKEVQKAIARDVVDTALSNPDFSTLVTAIKAAGLVDTLKGPGPFTVFAPTNAAFEKLGTETIETLLKPESKSTLASILTFHVVPGTVLAADVVKLKEAKTVNGQVFRIETKDGKVMIGNDPKSMATVTKTDIKCSNGVIHVIDTVILPKKDAPKPATKPAEKK